MSTDPSDPVLRALSAIGPDSRPRETRPPAPADAAPEDVGTQAAETADTAATTRPVTAGVGGSVGPVAPATTVRTRVLLAGGLVEVPTPEPADPARAVLTDPTVAEGRRFCAHCRRPVGRATPLGPGPTAGRCAHCDTPFDFAPQLAAGDLVAGQYEVQGCLAHGGLGWIYLAVDHNVDGRWVVLKGLLHSHDPQAQAVAVAERRFLAELRHPSLVKIFNFVEHRGADGTATGFIVMEFIGGTTLKALTADGPLPVTEAIAYVLEVLPALTYMNDNGLAYNDLKPDNIMVERGRITLIDLGAVSAIDGFGHIYGTPGFQAPEIGETGPTPATEVFTVGRTLAALTLAMPMDKGRPRDGLPTPQDAPLLAEHEFFHLLLRRCTDPDPDRRYPSIAALAADLAAVLREIIATRTGEPVPGLSTVFSTARTSFGTAATTVAARPGPDGSWLSRTPPTAAEIVAALPVPLVDQNDPAADRIIAAAHSQPAELLDLLGVLRQETAGEAGPPNIEIALAEVRALLELGEADTASEKLSRIRLDHGHDPRMDWYDGVAALHTGRLQDALAAFDAVLTALPGEQAPKLAVAATIELLDPHGPVRADDDAALRYYASLWRTDRTVTSAAFGLARRLRATGDAADAVAALDQVPPHSRHRDDAQRTAVVLLLSAARPAALDEQTLREAAERIATLPARDPDTLRLTALAAGTARGWLTAGGRPGDGDFLGVPMTDTGLRSITEQSLRMLARTVERPRTRYRLVDLANRTRPRTWH